MLSLIIVTLVLLISRGVDATGPAPAQQPGAQQRVFLPHVSNARNCRRRSSWYPLPMGFRQHHHHQHYQRRRRAPVRLHSGRQNVDREPGRPRILPTPSISRIASGIRTTSSKACWGWPSIPIFPTRPTSTSFIRRIENLEVARGVVNPATPTSSTRRPCKSSSPFANRRAAAAPARSQWGRPDVRA